MSVVSCPKCGSTNLFYSYKEERYYCRSCGHEWQKAYEELPKAEAESPAKFSEAIVRVEEVPTFTPAFLSAVEQAWRSKSVQTYWDWICEPTAEGVTVTLRGTTKPHEFFPKDIIERMKYDPVREQYYVPRTEAPGKLPWQSWIQPILEYVTDKTIMEGWAKEEDVYREWQSRGVSREDIEKVIGQLIREGTLYSPRAGFLRKT